jgi:hypothetical protein
MISRSMFNDLPGTLKDLRSTFNDLFADSLICAWTCCVPLPVQQNHLGGTPDQAQCPGVITRANWDLALRPIRANGVVVG